MLNGISMTDIRLAVLYGFSKPLARRFIAKSSAYGWAVVDMIDYKIETIDKLAVVLEVRYIHVVILDGSKYVRGLARRYCGRPRVFA